MTGRPAFSAAGQNQSALPLVSIAACSRMKVSRTPSMPFCSFHFGSSAAELESCTGKRPITAKRLG